ncbi:chemotaxis-specific protein-glutamate methyltransferase CheB [bacterium]|nr:chemotaxis-specific protein-glutamate methyltransferase CheB [bacterium]
MTFPDKLRVLVVDDSAMFRRAITRALGEMPEVHKIDTAVDGEEALLKIKGLQPDVVTLDLEMPGMDGLATLRELRQQGLRTRVLVVSAYGGEKRVVEALCLGAEDFILKPVSKPDGPRPTLKALLEGKFRKLFRPQSPALGVAPISTAPAPVALVVMGVSTGGPNALAEILPQMTRPVAVPIVIVQHISADFIPLLAERLRSKCSMPLHEAEANQVLQPGNIYLVPGNYHMEVTGTQDSPRAHLSQGPTENGCRPAADVLFRSAARLFGPECLAVVMTGMGKDGLAGCRAIVAAGGRCIAQDRESCVVWGMPRLVTEAGLACEVPLAQIGHRIMEMVEQGCRPR